MTTKTSPVPAPGPVEPRVGQPNQRMNQRRWAIIQLLLVAFAALLRLVNLGSPTDGGTPVFDEKHYVPQAWQILRGWDHLVLGGIEDNPGYGLVVHPPLAKEIMAAGMGVFGYTPFGWRVCAALAGVAVVCLIAGIARRLSRSDLVGLLAGVLALSDGILLLTSRSGMLDHFQTLFLVAAVYVLVRDHEEMERRYRAMFREGRIGDFPAGPRLGFRWWRFAAGIALGGTLAIKWSGLYYMAFFGVVLVALDAHRRWRYGVRRPLLGALLRDAPPHFFAVVIIPVCCYLLSWRAWFGSETSVYRHAVESGLVEDATALAESPLGFLPDSFLNFLYYHVSVLRFHSELTNSNGHNHPWESKPWSWLASTRGLMYYNLSHEDGTRTVELLVGTPAIWFPTVLVLAYGCYRLARFRDLVWVVPVVGFATGFLPWLLNTDRQMYLFYALNLAPFLIIGLALICGRVLGWRMAPSSKHRPVAWLQAHAGLVLVVAYLGFAVWNFLFFLPLYTAMPLSPAEWAARMWLPSWH